MDAACLPAAWHALAEAASPGRAAWRVQHPTATRRAIAPAIDDPLVTLRARLLADAALASAATDRAGLPGAARPVGPDCGHRLAARGPAVRRLTPAPEQTRTVPRRRAGCPHCGPPLLPPG